MEETTDTYGATITPAVPESYNPNLLVTYKVIRGYSDPEYATEKVASLEWDLHNGRERMKENGLLHSKIDAVKEIISEAYADSQDQDTLRAIAEALNIELTKTIEFTATIEVTGTIDIDLLSEWDNDFDSEPGSMDAHWDLEELRHRLVQTQRKLTSQDKDYENKVARLDADVDDLMNLFSKRPPGILIYGSYIYLKQRYFHSKM
jgi:hypothetical protein